MRRKVSFWVGSILVSNPKGPATRVIEIPEDRGGVLRSVDGRGRTQLDFDEAGNLRLAGKVVGEVSGDDLRIAGKQLKITVEKNPQARNFTQEWMMEIREGDKTLLRGPGHPMCMVSMKDQPALELRRRLLLYLGWREVLRGRGG